MIFYLGNAKLVELLLLHGANIDSANNKGNTSLHFAVAGGNFKLQIYEN